MKLISFPVNPYVGQIFYEPETEKLFEFCEVTKTDELTGQVVESAMWFDITEKDLVPQGHDNSDYLPEFKAALLQF